MAQYRNLVKRVRTFPTYAWRKDLEEEQKNFIDSLKLGEIFSIPGYGSAAYDSFKEKYQSVFNERGVIFDTYEFKIKRLKKDYPRTAIVLQKGKEIYTPPIEDAQIFDPNLIFTQKGA
jgi:hypothetical protein